MVVNTFSTRALLQVQQVSFRASPAASRSLLQVQQVLFCAAATAFRASQQVQQVLSRAAAAALSDFVLLRVSLAGLDPIWLCSCPALSEIDSLVLCVVSSTRQYFLER